MTHSRNLIPWLLAGDIVAALVVTLIGFLTHYGDIEGWRWLTTFIPVAVAWQAVAPWLGAYDTDNPPAESGLAICSGCFVVCSVGGDAARFVAKCSNSTCVCRGHGVHQCAGFSDLAVGLGVRGAKDEPQWMS